MGKKKQRKDKGALVYVSVKNRKKVKALIRELGLELVSVERIPDDKYDDPGKCKPASLHYSFFLILYHNLAQPGFRFARESK